MHVRAVLQQSVVENKNELTFNHDNFAANLMTSGASHSLADRDCEPPLNENSFEEASPSLDSFVPVQKHQTVAEGPSESERPEYRSKPGNMMHED